MCVANTLFAFCDCDCDDFDSSEFNVHAVVLVYRFVCACNLVTVSHDLCYVWHTGSTVSLVQLSHNCLPVGRNGLN